MNIYDFVKLEAEGLDEGTSSRIDCPKCGSTDKTLSLTLKDGLVLWNCYRDSCDARGRTDVGGTISAFFKEEERQAPTNIWQKRATKWWHEGKYLYTDAFRPETLSRAHTVWVEDKELLITSMFNCHYSMKRTGAKGYNLLGNKKSILTGENVGRRIWVRNNPYYIDTLYLVEDLVSGMWVYQELGVDVLVLFGTKLTDRMYNAAMQERDYKTFVWCLDADTNYGQPTFDKNQQRRFNFPCVRHVFRVLAKDPKAHTKEELEDKILY